MGCLNVKFFHSTPLSLLSYLETLKDKEELTSLGGLLSALTTIIVVDPGKEPRCLPKP